MSRFKGILDSAKNREPESTTVESPPPLPSPAPSVERKPGRPRGKRSDPTYTQVTAYIPDDIYHNIKLALLQERKGREFSELVGELLVVWLKSRD